MNQDKPFQTMAAEFALTGHALIRADAEGPRAPYYVTRWGWVKPIHSLEDAAQLLNQIKGGK
ncbi:hypothetical protein [Variovorax sp.]|uniref:hypothetical protein n=1 Tax=Variovorax sp. TaxID=1871043 RepID=UPI0025DAD8C1|nr:hypothetical protein [Variovorax sp.]